MNKVVLCPNPFRDSGLGLAERTRILLVSAGFEVVMSPVFSDLNIPPLSESIRGASLVVAFGGDGTFLHVARSVMGRDIPLLCVNMGEKGFMATLEPDNIALVLSAARGEYRPSRRMLADVTLTREGTVIYRDTALNDAVIKSPLNCIDCKVSSDGDVISHFSGDGVIVSTPTGSTAYSMSAGGPIVEPEAEAILVTSICAHVMAAASFVLSPERCVRVEPERLRGRCALLSVDGGEGVELAGGDYITVRRSPDRIIFADMGLKSFYDTAFCKLTQRGLE